MKELYSEGIKNKLLFVLGEAFYSGDNKQHAIRLSVASVHSHEISEGVKRLARLIEMLIIKSRRRKGDRQYMPIL